MTDITNAAVTPEVDLKRLTYKTEAQVFYKKLDVREGKLAVCDNPMQIGRKLTPQELADAKELCRLTADIFTGMSRKNEKRSLDLDYAKIVIDDSEEFTAFDPDLAFIPQMSGKTSIKGSKNWMSTWEKGFDDLEFLDKHTIIDLTIRLNGNIAIVTFTDLVNFKMKNGDLTKGGRNNTIVWSYRHTTGKKDSSDSKGEWKVIHEHASHI